jgi:hypothetical protein
MQRTTLRCYFVHWGVVLLWFNPPQVGRQSNPLPCLAKRNREVFSILNTDTIADIWKQQRRFLNATTV